MGEDSLDGIVPTPKATDSPQPVLRRGWTTGCCAAAAAAAAYQALLSDGRFPDPVQVVLPKGERPSFPLARRQYDAAGGWAEAGIIKDAGDDPDVTHGALILARVARRVGFADACSVRGVRFFAGDGVGLITRPGLVLPPGEPAINPGPRNMILDSLRRISESHDPEGDQDGVPDVDVTVSIPGGAALAERTLNGRLGIQGGLSILGTTGVVVPFSCSAWIHSIHRGIDVARAEGLNHLAGATGRTSEAAVQAQFGLPETALVDMGDFAGAVLTYLRRHPVPRFTVAGGFAKISKLADGHMDLHSRRSQVDFSGLADRLARLGADSLAIARARDAVATGAVLAEADRCAVDLPALVATQALGVARDRIADETGARHTEVDITIYGRDGRLIAHAR